MNTSAKIRWLLLAIGLCLFLTAYTARQTYTAKDKLGFWTSRLQDKLQDKERLVADMLASPVNMAMFRALDTSRNTAITITGQMLEKNLKLATFRKNRLLYWSDNNGFTENPARFREGRSFVLLPNGYYEAIKRTDADFTLIFLIPVKSQYHLSNTFLKNVIAPDLAGSDVLDIAPNSASDMAPVYSINKEYLFSVRLIRGVEDGFFSRVEMWSCLLGILVLCMFVHSSCRELALRGRVWLATGILVLFIFGLRLVNLRFGIPDLSADFGIFKPEAYADAFYRISSLGDFVINILCIAWVVIFLHAFRDTLIRHKPGKIAGFAILLLCCVLIIFTGSYFLVLFRSLIINSNINFDVNNVLNLSWYTVTGAVALCFAYLVIYIVIEIALSVSLSLSLKPGTLLFTFTTLILLTTLNTVLIGHFTVFYMLIACVALTQGYSIYYQSGTLTAGKLLVVLFIFSIITSIKLSDYQQEKELEFRKKIVGTIDQSGTTDDIYQIGRLEQELVGDQGLKRYFSDPKKDPFYLRNRFQQLYYDGYLNRYSYKFYAFNEDERPIEGDTSFSIRDFNSTILYGTEKVTNYFYRANDDLGYHSYLARIPVNVNGTEKGMLVIELEAKPVDNSGSYAQLLIETRSKPDIGLNQYSYALYRDDKLLEERGRFIYPLVNTRFKGVAGRNVYYNDHEQGYNHLVVRGGDRKVIIVSKENITFFDRLAALTFFFLFFLVFLFIILCVRWLLDRFRSFQFRFRNVRWSFLLSTNRILYKTRIQVSMIAAVVVTLLVAGFITYVSISRQYDRQQDDLLLDRVTRITSELRNEVFNAGSLEVDEQSKARFYSYASTFSTDLTLFDTNGRPVLTTQPKLYEFDILGSRMNALAFIYLSKFQQSQYINSQESIGQLTFKSGYAPIRDNKQRVLGYLQVPYFSNQTDYNDRIGAFLNTLINVYALIFLAIGLFAVFVANQITLPLTIIQENLARIAYGRKNEPIYWRRDDEIGSLIREYNNMLAALDESARKLGESERKGAWREMAKQVAHEIKNPLTPMKLGLQLLEKAWKRRDPEFDTKFERFSKSFIEQIESLALIATEFSNFAKMPETRVENVNVSTLLQDVIHVFHQSARIKIDFEAQEGIYQVAGDKDHLLRCFNNLVKNAIEAIPKAGTGKIMVKLSEENGQILISIQDNGSGIPGRLARRIFEPNFTTKSSGSGLGLPFVKNALENMGGTIRFETAPYSGTTFFITLPKA
ncbi:MAG: HAMP domain-containing histidine kinase [Mucilaginibacter polytrichastri]|nr:HAMP domain-containing histidine kinase [Mucilaginibacter polytrichastri]